MPAVVRRAVLVAIPPWLVSRALAGLALWIAWLHHDHRFPVSGHGAAGATGIWAWDAAWYRSIAEDGYAGQLHVHGERFFPLLPLLGRWLGSALGGHPDVALVLVTNVAALGFGAGVAVLTLRELGPRVAVPATWLTLLAPGAVVLATAYAEALAGLLAVCYLLAARAAGRWVWWAVPIGLLAGLARPTGFLLAVVPLVELWTRRHADTTRDRLRLVAAMAAPVAGAGVYCLWTAAVDDQLLLPFTAQSAPGLRGGILTNPLHGIFLAPNHGGVPVAVRVAIVAVAVALLVLTWQRLPRSIAVWATLLLMAAVTSAQGTSLPRYLSADFPLLMALATLAVGRVRTVVVAGASPVSVVTIRVRAFVAGIG